MDDSPIARQARENGEQQDEAAVGDGAPGRGVAAVRVAGVDASSVEQRVAVLSHIVAVVALVYGRAESLRADTPYNQTIASLHHRSRFFSTFVPHRYKPALKLFSMMTIRRANNAQVCSTNINSAMIYIFHM